jgi:very-short-patch-repair endonuclease
MLAVEVEGGSWIAGRHVRARGFEADCEKYNAAVLLGWRILRFTTAMIESGAAISAIEAAFGMQLSEPQKA